MSNLIFKTHSSVTFNQPTHICSKHGAVYPLRIFDEPGMKLRSEHCMECYKDWIAANIPIVKPTDAGEVEPRDA